MACKGFGLPIMAALALNLTACYHPPYNNFKKDRASVRRTAGAAGVGTAVGAAAGYPIVGLAAGAAVGGAVSLYRESKPAIIKALAKQHIQYVQYGDTITLIVPTDQYFVYNTARLQELCYPGLVNIIRLLRHYPDSPVYIAGFTDEIGSRAHKFRMSEARAETMLGFLWANNVKAQLLKAEGYGDKHPISDNRIIHGSAQNRRLEIQWVIMPKGCKNCPAPAPMIKAYQK